MPTGADLIEGSRSHLTGATREPLNELAAPVGLTDTTILLAHSQQMPTGAVLSLGLESMYVWSFNSASQTASVRRGFGGSSPSAHAAGDLVRINPRWTDFRLFQLINNQALAIQSEGLYAVGTLTRTWSFSQRGLNLDAAMIGERPLNVAYRTLSGLKEWIDVSNSRTIPAVDTSDYLSGKVLKLSRGLPDGCEVRVVYKRQVGQLAFLTDDAASTTGLPSTSMDLLSIGAAIQAMAGQSVIRSNPTTQPPQREPSDVTEQGVANSANGLRVLYQQRLSRELTAQASLYPHRLQRYGLPV